MIIDGRVLAAEVLARAKMRAASLPHAPKVIAYIGANVTPATRSFLNIKKQSAAAAGCVFEEVTSVTDIDKADAVIAQLPTTPEGEQLLATLPIEKDADVLSPEARIAFKEGRADALLPPVVAAIAEIFSRYAFDPKGKRTVVVGSGFLVGEPAAEWLTAQGALVTVLTLGDDLAPLKEADLIISGAGSPHLIKPDMIKEGVVLIDAGTSEASGKLAGDADPACAEQCALFTPVPGGVGPLAVACLFDNATRLAKSAINT